MKQVHGFSLSELLIALFLSCLILSGLSQFYLVCKTQYLFVQKRAANLMEILWIRDMISNSIRFAGFSPCLRLDKLVTNLNRPFIQSMPESLETLRMDAHFVQVQGLVNGNELHIPVSNGLNAKQDLLIADCFHAEQISVQTVYSSNTGLVLRLSKPLQFEYRNPVYLGNFLDERWSVYHDKLYYHFRQTQELSDLIHGLLIHIKDNHGHVLVDVRFILDGKEYPFQIAVRAQ